MNRERLTITLRSDLLKQLDGLIDGERLRNRSHAIEYFLSRSLGAKAVKVLILAGGKPVYPRTFDLDDWSSVKIKSDDNRQKSQAALDNKGAGVYFESEKKSLPKTMVKIAGKPLLEQTLLRLKTFKLTDVVISVGEGENIIENYFKDGSQFGMNIHYLQQNGKCKGTAEALLQAKDLMRGENFLLLYGDVLSDIDYNDFLEFHRQQKSSVCTMALTSSQAVDLWGLAQLNGSKIVSFEEKPKNPKTFSRLINAGVYCMDQEIFKYLDKAEKLESMVFPRLAEEGKLTGYPFEGFWLDVSSSAAYKQALKEMSKNDKI